MIRRTFCNSRSDRLAISVMPVDGRTYEDLTGLNGYFNSNSDPLFQHNQLLALNPNDDTEIDRQYEISFQRSRDNPSLNLGDLNPNILDKLYEYLEFEETLKMRMINRSLLIHHLLTSRSKLCKQLHPQIVDGFECLHKSTLSACLLSRLERPLNKLFSEDTRQIFNLIPSPKMDGSPSKELHTEIEEIEIKLERTNRLDEFLLLALHFYRRTHSISYYNLLDVLLNAKIFDQNKILSTLPLNLNSVFFAACRHNFVRLGILVLDRVIANNDCIGLVSAIHVCLDKGNFLLFEALLNVLKPSTTLNLDSIFGRVLASGNLKFIRSIMGRFPQLSTCRSLNIFVPILIKNAQVLEEYLKFRGDQDYSVESTSGFSPIQAALLSNFTDGIEVLSRYYAIFKARRAHNRVIRYASCYTIDSMVEYYDHFRSCEALSDIMRGIFQGDRSLHSMSSSEFLIEAITRSIKTKNLPALTEILNYISDVAYHYFQKQAFYPIMTAIQYDFYEGFRLFIERFGVEILKYTDISGMNPFLWAFYLRKFDLAFMIAELNINHVDISDYLGNNALHYALLNNYSYEIMLKLSRLGVSWFASNYRSKSPERLLRRLEQRFNAYQLNELYTIIDLQ